MIDHVNEVTVPASDPQRVDSVHRRIQGRVLLVEDSTVNQKLIHLMLTRSGLDVELADNGRIGCEKATQARDAGTPYDVILMDMQMPEMDGYEATSLLRQQGYQVPIIALTAHAMDSDRRKCLDAGCDEYLTKPIEQDRLITIVAGFVADSPAKQSSTAGRSHAQSSNTVLVSEYADDPDLADLVVEFVEQLPQRIERLEQAVNDADRSQLADVAHQLAGAAGGYGFASITQVARTLEQQALRETLITPLRATAAELTELCRQAVASIDVET